MSGFVNLLDDCDEETLLFKEEMRREEHNLRSILARSGRRTLPQEVTIDRLTLRRLMQRHNQAVTLLRELVALNPVENNLTRRARQLTENPE